jgi:hypothetical protein
VQPWQAWMKQVVKVNAIAHTGTVVNKQVSAQTNQPLGAPTLRRALHIGRAFAATLLNCHSVFRASVSRVSRAPRILFETCTSRPTACATSPQLIGECLRMPTPSRSQIIQSKPIAGGLDRFRDFFNSTYENAGISETSQVLGPVGNEGTVDMSF